MASGSSSQLSLRDAIRAIIKDTSTIGPARVSSEYKTINASILKATDHVEFLPKEKYVKVILAAASGSRPRADVSYCIHALQNRLAKTNSWVVALKTLIIIHRALREVDNSFLEELSYHSQDRGHILNLLHFKEDSNASASDYSSWIRTYALYIEECLQCFRVLKYDFYTDHLRTKKLEAPVLLQHLPALQLLLLRLLCCQPVGAARYNYMIQYALSIVAADSVRLYVAITDGVLILVDKFFEMQRGESVPALEIYRKAVNQAQKLSDFFEMCRSLEFGQSQKYVKIEQPPATFLTAMEDYIRDAPQPLMLPWTSNNDDECVTPKLVAILDTKEGASEEGSHSSDDCEETTKSNEVAQPVIIPDLLSWDEPSEEASVSMAEQESSNTTVDSRDVSGWELALPTTPTSHAPPLSLCMGGVVNRSVLDSLYETAVTKPSGNGGVSHTRKTSSNPFEADEYVYNENIFYSGYNQNMLYYPSLVAHQSFMQVAEAYQHPSPFLHHQDQSMVVYDYMQNAGVYPQQPQSPEQNYQQRYQQPQSAEQSYQQRYQHPHHQDQSMVVYDYMQTAGVHQQQPQSPEQNYQQRYQQPQSAEQNYQQRYHHPQSAEQNYQQWYQQPQSAEQNYQQQQRYLQMAGIHQQQQESWAHASDVSPKHMFETPPTEVAVQQQGKPVAGHRSTVSFGNPFE